MFLFIYINVLLLHIFITVGLKVDVSWIKVGNICLSKKIKLAIFALSLDWVGISKNLSSGCYLKCIVLLPVIHRTEKEMNRRKDNLANLRSKVNQMASTLNMSNFANRDSLIGPEIKPADAVSRTVGLDNSGLVGLQRQVMKGVAITYSEQCFSLL